MYPSKVNSIKFTYSKGFAGHDPSVFACSTSDIRVAVNVGIFKRKLKTWMFHRLSFLEHAQIVIGLESAVFECIDVCKLPKVNRCPV